MKTIAEWSPWDNKRDAAACHALGKLMWFSDVDKVTARPSRTTINEDTIETEIRVVVTSHKPEAEK